MKNSGFGNKNFSKLSEELKELVSLYNVDATAVYEGYTDVYGFGEDYIWDRLCDSWPELREATKEDSDKILSLLKQIHAGKVKKVKRSEEKENVIQTSVIEKDGTLYEEIFNDGVISFIDGEGKTYDTLEGDGFKHEPIFGDELIEGAVLLPSGVESYKDEKTLIEEIKNHIHRYIDISPFFETIATYYILLSWLYDEINTLPYLRVLGDTGTGKSRFLDIVGRLCYKATLVSGAITPAPIYRLIRKWHGTIVIDEGDFRASDEQNEVVKILNCGFERGRPVVRSQKDNPDSLQILPTFSPKIIASRKRFKDIALESRCLTEITKETDREDIPYLLPSEFYLEEEKLRNKLLLFRFRNYDKVDVEKAQKLKDVDVENRLKQATSSFIVLFANNEEVYKDFMEFLTAYNRDLVEERADTFEGAIVNAIWDLVQRTSSTESISNVQNDVNVLFKNEDLDNVRITANDISILLIEKYGFKEVSSRKVGRILKTLGIMSKKEGTGKERKRYLNLEQRTLAKLIKKYIPSFILEKDEEDKKDVGIGERGEEELEGEKLGKGACQICRENAILTVHNGRGICQDCLKEEEERKPKTKKEKTTRIVNIEDVEEDGSIPPEALDKDVQDKQNREAGKRGEETGILEPRKRDAETTEEEKAPDPLVIPPGEKYDPEDNIQVWFIPCKFMEDICSKCGKSKNIEYKMEKGGEQKPICNDCIWRMCHRT